MATRRQIERKIDEVAAARETQAVQLEAAANTFLVDGHTFYRKTLAHEWLFAALWKALPGENNEFHRTITTTIAGAALLAPPGEIMHKWIPAALAGNEQIRELAIQSAFAAGAGSLLLAKAFEHEFASKKNPDPPATEQ